MIHQHNEKAQAIMFIGREGVSKELLYPEFEAVLDGFVPMNDWADRVANAVYLEINSEFCVTAAVFFLVEFNAKGEVEASWNLPLVDLARTAAKGPDLGAGPIHLVCASQCPVALFRSRMWDPDMSSHGSHFNQIKKAVKRNRMGLHFKSPDKHSEFGDLPPAAAERMGAISKQLGEQYEKELRLQIAQLLKDQRLQMSTMASNKEKAVNEVRLQYLHKIEALQEHLDEKSRQLADAAERNQELTDTVNGQVKKIEGLREYFEQKLERVQGADTGLNETLLAQIEAETEAKIAAATREASELLHMRDVELSYRKEHEQVLEAELAELRSENRELLDNAGDHILETLSRKGVNFVTYQPGAGHITIPVTQISLFLSSPVAFTADYCGVSEKHYQSWLQHYQAPVCIAQGPGGQTCGANVPRITNPAAFIPGESNYCDEHNLLHEANAVHT